MAYGLAVLVKKWDKESDVEVEWLQYGLSLWLNYIFVITFTITIGLIIGSHFLDIILAIFCFALLRRYSGGLHVNSSEMCVLISTIILTTIPLIKVTEQTALIMSIVSIVILFIGAPLTYKVKANWQSKVYLKLKFISILIVLLNLLTINYETITVAFFVQSLTTLFKLNRNH
ncbi:accessory gene regulator B family protein [Paenibacillus cremeus]|uniref:Accessory regulator AgrB n=1 Tax=Paenibacillus cremeus TaxID=2163881 RepID=A0A559KCN4_9BACL|nr:hypothetical protein FPZ49_11025 [Paenibacillus cremeus]